jgi:glycine oxidase
VNPSDGTDVVVVGAGVIGLSCAWRLAERGLSVRVLERDQPGAGASGVAAGMLAPVTEAEFGEEALLRMNLDSASRWPEFAAALRERAGTEVGYTRGGALVVAVDRDDAEELRRLHEFQRSLGLESEWLTPSAARRMEPALSPRIAGAIHAPHEAQADPRLLVGALAKAVLSAGGEIVTGASVDDLRELDGATVIVAAGASPLTESAGIRPVKGQILRLRRRAGAAPLAARLIRTPRVYVVDRPSGEVVVGATVEDRGYDMTITADAIYTLLEDAIEVLPDVRELDFVEAAARLRPATADNHPLIARDDDGVVWATGHYRNGVLLAPATAVAVESMVAGVAA